MKNDVLKLSALVLMFMLAFTSLAQAASVRKPPVNPVKPVFTSSFIQSWYCEDWDAIRWHQELLMLQEIGITEVIIQNTVDTTPTYKLASYPSTMEGYTSNEVDLLDNALSVADVLGMNIRIGTGTNDEWWSKGATDKDWLASEAKTNIAVVDEIALKYTAHPSFKGWYLSYEISNITATTRSKQANLNAFIKDIVSEMKLKAPDKTVMVSPFYNSKLTKQGSLTNWTLAITNIFKGTGVDILALQDSVGVGYNRTNQLGNIFASTKKGTDAAGLILYANSETFTSTSMGNVPVAQSRITRQIANVNKYVAGHVAFSLSHFQDKYGDTPAKNERYLDYKKYYQTK